MKIVINKCHGGFGLSATGMAHYLKLKGIEYGTQKTRLQWRDGDEDFYEAGHVGDDNRRIDSRDISRDDPALIQTLIDLGGAADGWAASLAIVEIPDGVQWQIEEYDGAEWVAEKHRTWS